MSSSRTRPLMVRRMRYDLALCRTGVKRASRRSCRVARTVHISFTDRPSFLALDQLRPPRLMPYVITEACITVKDKSCVDVCPVDCIYEGPDQLFIRPDECIDCGACEPECPVTAIFPEEDVPGNMREYIQINRDVFKSENPPGKPQR